MTDKRASKHLHGVKLDRLISELVKHYGWEGLAEIVKINCFKKNPSVKSSVKFLLKTPWALENVQDLYVAMCTATPTAEIAVDVEARVPAPRRKPAMSAVPKKVSQKADIQDVSDVDDPWARAKLNARPKD